jgi:uncharacterized iron-regulated membrane protein
MKLRQTVLRLHRQIGLLLGLLFALLGLTGSILVFHHELYHWLSRSLTEVSMPESSRLSVDEIVKIVRSSYPNQPLTWLDLPKTPQSSYLAYVSTGANHDLEVYVDPSRGTILGTQEWDHTFLGVIYNFHAELWAGDRGREIIGFSGLFLTFLAFTGVAITPKWHRFPKSIQIRWRSSRKLLTYDLHKSIGLIFILLLVFLALTGSGINFNQQVMAVINEITQTSTLKVPVSRVLPGKMPLPLAAQLQKANTEFPTATVTGLSLPTASNGTVDVYFKLPGNPLLGEFNTLYLDQYSAQVLQVETASSMPPATRYLYAVFMLHTGRYGGLPTQLLYLIIGFVPMILAITGLVMQRNRRRSAKVKRASQVQPESIKS